MRRFYKAAASTGAEGGFGVALDGKPILTPARAPLLLPTRALADAIAAEWADQGDEIRPAGMHLMQLAATCLDKVGPHRAAVTAQVAAFGETDLLCYRAERPAELAARQRALWQPLLDWALAAFDAPLLVTSGVAPIVQPPEAIGALRAAILALDDWRLTALHVATASLGSVVLGLALVHGRIGTGEAFEAAEVDVTYQIERWGEDHEATARRALLRQEIDAAARLIALL
jgi:chaperone required for assembly of F1-ATPase